MSDFRDDDTDSFADIMRGLFAGWSFGDGIIYIYSTRTCSAVLIQFNMIFNIYLQRCCWRAGSVVGGRCGVWCLFCDLVVFVVLFSFCSSSPLLFSKQNDTWTLLTFSWASVMYLLYWYVWYDCVLEWLHYWSVTIQGKFRLHSRFTPSHHPMNKNKNKVKI